MITVKGISKSYGKKQVLNQVSITLEPGKVYGVVGENGAGKTTLFKCLAGLENYSGKIESPYNPLKNYMGFLTANPVFMSKITGWEYLKLLSIARDNTEEEFEERNIFELDLQQYVETYSTGMQKKLALLGILLQNNEIFILDEPFNGVDIHSNIIIAEIIKKLKALNKIVVISSHIFSILSETCDEIHVLEKGVFTKVVEKADFEQLNKEMKNFAVGNHVEKLNLR